jgi:hypothetical protein
MRALLLLILISAGLGWAGCASNHGAASPPVAASAQTTIAPMPVQPAEAATLVRAEQIRTDCIQGRRLICGRVLKVSTNGLVIDSGYADLLRPPLGQSWIIPGTVPASRKPDLLEGKESGSLAIGLVFLTDVPRRQKPKQYDYVVLMGYPAGHYVYTPVPGVEKTIRRFASGLATAVRLNLQAEENIGR